MTKKILVITQANALPVNVSIQETYGTVTGHMKKGSPINMEEQCRQSFSEANAVVGLIPTGERVKNELTFIGTAVKVAGLGL